MDEKDKEREMARIAMQLAAVEDENAATIGAPQPEDDMVPPDEEFTNAYCHVCGHNVEADAAGNCFECGHWTSMKL